MNTPPIQLNPAWLAVLADEFEQAYMQQLGDFLRAEKKAGKVIYPPSGQIFAALNAVSPEQVKVVVLGQDPYHGPNQANGLSFSVPAGQAAPPSLRNIYKELQADLQLAAPAHGDLKAWAEQGVLLLNSLLTVEHGLAASHHNQGWERFTDQIIATINQQCEHVVFMLWGNYAQRKGQNVDPDKHLILQAPHPSPLSAHRGFLGCRHFSKANHYLEQHGRTPINWVLD